MISFPTQLILCKGVVNLGMVPMISAPLSGDYPSTPKKQTDSEHGYGFR